VTTRLVNRRIRLVVAVFAVVFAAVFARAAWLQAVRAGGLDAIAASQHRETVAIPAHRGTIYDRVGRALAIGELATTVYANPKQIRDPQEVADRVATALDLDADDLVPLLSDRSKGFVYLKRKADPERAELLEEQNIVGLGFMREERRSYPQRGIGSEVVGYAGLDNKGLAGLELELDDVLSGSPGTKSVVRDPFGRALRVLETKPVAHGSDVYITLDETLQGHVERILADTRKQWAAQAATAIVLDPKTGGVLAMAVEPGFDANRYPDVSRERQRNRAVTDTYEPGSTFKVVTLGGVLESGMVTPTTKYTLKPSIRVSDRVIHDAEPRPTMTMTVAEILSKSSNVGTITLALGLGPDGLSHWIDRFGFGHKTGVDFPGESEGIVLPTSKWSGSTIGNVPIGQGIAVTPIQMASVYGALANGGVAVEPHLVDRIEGRGSEEPKRTRLISRATADQVTAMLRAVVREGSGTAARVAGYSVAGKTGTAAKPDPVLGGYSTSKYVSSFVGFVPSTRPRLCILVTVDEPKGAIWGGAVAAPAFSKIASFALQYLEVPPDQTVAAASAATG
jgi:cell division protein FtsI (penicillin-binding protein 3)/stage V sporulation protein D (sporulation-specific penicillin-binding protein)